MSTNCSGPWKLSIVISGLFFWLSVFIVGHCYDRGQEYSTYFGREDNDYLQDVDDDMLVMETIWFVCVSIIRMLESSVMISVIVRIIIESCSFANSY